jgi:hypothetical protein
VDGGIGLLRLVDSWAEYWIFKKSKNKKKYAYVSNYEEDVS